jgi:hypothetical protein
MGNDDRRAYRLHSKDTAKWGKGTLISVVDSFQRVEVVSRGDKAPNLSFWQHAYASGAKLCHNTFLHLYLAIFLVVLTKS